MRRPDLEPMRRLWREFNGLNWFDRTRAGAAAVAPFALIVAVVVGGGGSTDPAFEGGGRGSQEKAQRSFLSRMIPPPPDPILAGSPRSVAELAERLPLERKVGQLLLVGFEGTNAKSDVGPRLEKTDIGGVIIGPENYESPGQISKLTAELDDTTRRAGQVIPLTLTTQEGGEESALADLPPKQPPAALRSPEAANRESRKSANALLALGIDGVLGPVVDIGAEGGALGERAYSDDADQVSEYATASVEGYQQGGVFSAPAHFPGLGAAAQSPDDGPASVGLDVDDLRSRDVLPFTAAIEAGAPAILVGNGSYATDDFVTPASQSRAIVTGLLRDELDFEGLAIADDLSSPAVAVIASVPDAAVASLAAGADMVYLGSARGDQDATFIAILNAVRDGEISREQLDRSVLRVLVAKENAGLIR